MRYAISLALLLLFTPGYTEAQTILSFFDLPRDLSDPGMEWDIPDGYGGLQWHGGNAGDPNYWSPDYGTFAYVGGAVARIGGFDRPQPFRFFSLRVGTNYRWFDLEPPPPGWPFSTAIVSAFLRGHLVRSDTVAEPSTWAGMYDSTEPALVDFGGVWVDRVEVLADGVTNVTVDLTPEPMSMALLATGLVGLGAVQLRRKRRAVA